MSVIHSQSSPTTTTTAATTTTTTTQNDFEYKYNVLLEDYNKLKLEYQDLRTKYDQLLIQSISSNNNINIPTSTYNGGESATSPPTTPNTKYSQISSISTTPTSTSLTVSSNTIVNTPPPSSTEKSPSSSTTTILVANTTPTTTTTAASATTTEKSSTSNSNSNGKVNSISQSPSASKEMLHSSGNSINKEKKMDKFLKFMNLNHHHSGKGSKGEKKKDSASSSLQNTDKLQDSNNQKNDFDYDSKVNGLSTLYRHIPELEVIATDSQPVAYISGPDYTPGTEPTTTIDQPMVKYPSNYGDSIYAVSTSTYPFPIGNTVRDGDPIADRYTCVVYNNRLVTCLADGCNWGERPKAAAQRASQAFIDHLTSRNDEITNVKEAGRILFDAFENAHKNILDGKTDQDYWQIGTTTLLGGVLLEINKGQDKWSPQWEFVCASVGDCKAFLITQTEIVDITEGNRVNLDAKDCGGRLGPHLDSGKPDLRNLNIFCASAYTGDIIIMVSDGIHDNLDPSHLGKSPTEMSKEFNLSADKWSDIDSPKAMVAKNAYCASFLENLLQGTSIPSEIANRLLDHCWNTTKSSRHFMETQTGKRLPHDYNKYPGKMDHTTCIAFKVGHFNSSSQPSNSGFQQHFGVAETPSKSIISSTQSQKDWIKVSPSTKNQTLKKSTIDEFNNIVNSSNTTPTTSPNVNSIENSPVLTSTTTTNESVFINNTTQNNNNINNNTVNGGGSSSIDQNPNLF